MAKCAICEKGPHFGNAVSHSNRNPEHNKAQHSAHNNPLLMYTALIFMMLSIHMAQAQETRISRRRSRRRRN